MAITQEMIDSLFDRELGPGTEPTPDKTSNRKHSRLPFRGRANAVVFPLPSKRHAEPQEGEVLTTDISRSGLSVLHRNKLHPGQQILLILARGNCMVEVRWCCEVWSGLYAAGCRFVDEVPPGPLE